MYSIKISGKEAVLDPARVSLCDAIMIWAKHHTTCHTQNPSRTRDVRQGSQQELPHHIDIVANMCARPIGHNYFEAVQCQWFRAIIPLSINKK